LIDQVADEIERIFLQADEHDKPHSYMPNCIDLGLVPHSPFSVTANPNTHNWIHILGSLGGLERSKKASVVGSPGPALVLASVARSRKGFTATSNKNHGHFGTFHGHIQHFLLLFSFLGLICVYLCQSFFLGTFNHKFITIFMKILF
jgi:Rhabdovirus nucleocapsid protein